MKVVQKFKTSSLKSVVREHMGFGQKWLSEPWGPNGKYMSVTEFLSGPQGLGNHFNQKQKGAVPWTLRPSQSHDFATPYV